MLWNGFSFFTESKGKAKADSEFTPDLDPYDFFFASPVRNHGPLMVLKEYPSGPDKTQPTKPPSTRSTQGFLQPPHARYPAQRRSVDRSFFQPAIEPLLSSMPVVVTSSLRRLEEPSYPRLHGPRLRGPIDIPFHRCLLQSVQLQQQKQPSESERRLDGNISNHSFDNSTQLVELQQQGHTNWVTSVGFSPDGNRIVSGSMDKSVRVWDAKTDEHLRELQGHTDSVTSVGFSTDGNQIVFGSLDKSVRVWDGKTGKQLRELQGHTDIVRSVEFAPDGHRIVSGSDDRSVRVWDAKTGEQLRKLNRDVEIEKTDQVHLVTLTPAIGVAPGPPPLLALRPLDIGPPLTLDHFISNSWFAVTETMKDDGLYDVPCPFYVPPLPGPESFQSANSLTTPYTDMALYSVPFHCWDFVSPYACPYQPRFEGQASSSSSTVESSQSRRHIPPEQVLQEHSPDDKLKVYQILNTSSNRVEVTSRIHDLVKKLRRAHFSQILESASSYYAELSPVSEKSRRKQDASLQCLLCEASLTTEHDLQSESFINGKF